MQIFSKFRLIGRTGQPATSAPESVYFYTLHKCASGLFSDYVLKNVRGLQLVDYSDQFYNGAQISELTFAERGFVYGPIRVSTGPPSLMYSKVIEPMSRSDFVRDKRIIFLIRDPRDILVSAYYSFGYSHGFSAVKEIHEQQQRLRDFIRTRTIDEYVLESAPPVVLYFQTIDRLAGACQHSMVLKYEDMINNWKKFAVELTRYLNIDGRVLRQAYRKSRPRSKEDPTSHRRSGKTGAYKEKLLPSTIHSLNALFAPILTRFEYEA